MMNIANKLTDLRIFLVPIFVISMIMSPDNGTIPLIIFVLASLTDFLDGYLARKHNLVTTFGKFLDPVADKLLTLSAFIMLIEKSQIPAWGVCVIVSREIAITGFRVIAASSGTTIAASSFGKIKTITQIVSIILLLLNFEYAIYVFYLAVIFTLLSGVEYFVKNKDALDLTNI